MKLPGYKEFYGIHVFDKEFKFFCALSNLLIYRIQSSGSVKERTDTKKTQNFTDPWNFHHKRNTIKR